MRPVAGCCAAAGTTTRLVMRSTRAPGRHHGRRRPPPPRTPRRPPVIGLPVRNARTKLGIVARRTRARSAQPPVAMFGYEPVVRQLRPGAAHTVDGLALAGRELLPRIETPAPGQ